MSRKSNVGYGLTGMLLVVSLPVVIFWPGLIPRSMWMEPPTGAWVWVGIVLAYMYSVSLWIKAGASGSKAKSPQTHPQPQTARSNGPRRKSRPARH